ncbi:hypothetical protein BX600DRAFT_20706 [Xylariales sp. PMI_506]|nr:hypothetical protein BX600DRAFT_20706 [Xylariales sp. PMI_506]
MSDLARTLSNNNAPPMSSTALMPPSADADSASRPRNRRAPASATTGANRNPSTSRLSPGISPAASRSESPAAFNRSDNAKFSTSGRASPVNQSFGKGLLDGPWAPSWSSVQDFASSWLSGGESGYNSEPSRPNSRSGSKPRQKMSMWKGLAGGSSSAAGNGRKLPDIWGPAPPSNSSRPRAEDIAAGSLSERQSALMAMKTASVLESYEGVNGGLDVAGKFKRRNSDENLTAKASEPVIDDQLAYLHHVQPTDTYAGVVLRYRCQEHAFRKANGLWSRDNIQVRKHLIIPVDTCEVKGRPCDPPNFYNAKVDHLATTPQPESFLQGSTMSTTPSGSLHDDFFGSQHGKSRSLPEEEQPWTHFRWVKLDSFDQPVEIVRVSRKAMGFFPPRRKKSVHTISTFSTPRQSLDLARTMTGISSEGVIESPGRAPLRRQSSASGLLASGSLGTTPSIGRSRGNSVTQGDGVPVWMRRPGGVGSMGRSVKAPGPAKDYLNTWVNKRLPKGFNIDSMPSMSVMGSESAHWGFGSKTDEEAPAGIVESPFEDGRDATLVNNKQGIGLEQAAATIETWLRGAWAKRPASASRLGSYRRTAEDTDLIELTDTNSDDGRPRTPLRIPEANLMNSGYFGSSGRGDHESEGNIRGRPTGPKGKKSD